MNNQHINILKILEKEAPDFKRLRNNLNEAIQLNNTYSNLPRVVVCGLLKAGKSSLLNALTNHLENEHFATKSSRATVANQELIHDGIIYIDTPGIDATDEEAWRGLMRADYVVFVHNARIAVLDKSEEDFLKELICRYPLIQRNMLVVLTNIDSIDNETITIESIKKCFNLILGEYPSILTTSFTSYKKGFLENKQKLREKSGVDNFRKLVKDRLVDGEWLNIRIKNVSSIKLQINQYLMGAIKFRQKQLEELSKNQEEKYQSLYRDTKIIKGGLNHDLYVINSRHN